MSKYDSKRLRDRKKIKPSSGVNRAPGKDTVEVEDVKAAMKVLGTDDFATYRRLLATEFERVGLISAEDVERLVTTHGTFGLFASDLERFDPDTTF
jgi:hypothetical protein